MEPISQSIPIFNFAAAQRDVHAWMASQKVGYWGTAYMGNKLAEEKGEVTEQLRNFEYPGKYAPYDAKELGMELGDVLFAIICLANTGAELSNTCEGVGPFVDPKIMLKNIHEAPRKSPSTFELDAALTDAIGSVCKDIQRMPQGPKRKDNVSPDIEAHLNDVAATVASLAAAMDIPLKEAWNNAIEKYNIRDAKRWK